MSIPCITHQDKSRRSKNSLVKLVKVVRGGVAGSDALVVDSPLELVAPAKKGRLLYRQVDVLLVVQRRLEDRLGEVHEVVMIVLQLREEIRRERAIAERAKSCRQARCKPLSARGPLPGQGDVLSVRSSAPTSDASC